MNKFVGFFISIGVVIVDQLSKFWIVANYLEYQVTDILPIFSITRVHNTGAGWSFLSDASGWQRWFFVAVSTVVSLVIIAMMLKIPKHQNKWSLITLALILGGAVGNLIDRLLYGYVVDFISVHYANYFFPVFNVADIAISIGALMMLVDIFYLQRKKTLNGSTA